MAPMMRAPPLPPELGGAPAPAAEAARPPDAAPSSSRRARQRNRCRNRPAQTENKDKHAAATTQAEDNADAASQCIRRWRLTCELVAASLPDRVLDLGDQHARSAPLHPSVAISRLPSALAALTTRPSAHDTTAACQQHVLAAFEVSQEQTKAWVAAEAKAGPSPERALAHLANIPPTRDITTADLAHALGELQASAQSPRRAHKRREPQPTSPKGKSAALSSAAASDPSVSGATEWLSASLARVASKATAHEPLAPALHVLSPSTRNRVDRASPHMAALRRVLAIVCLRRTGLLFVPMDIAATQTLPTDASQGIALRDSLVEFEKSVLRRVAEAASRADDGKAAHAVRLWRERQAQEGCCVVCLDTAPDIFMACCGAALHTDCLAKTMLFGVSMGPMRRYDRELGSHLDDPTMGPPPADVAPDPQVTSCPNCRNEVTIPTALSFAAVELVRRRRALDRARARARAHARAAREDGERDDEGAGSAHDVQELALDSFTREWWNIGGNLSGNIWDDSDTSWDSHSSNGSTDSVGFRGDLYAADSATDDSSDGWVHGNESESEEDERLCASAPPPEPRQVDSPNLGQPHDQAGNNGGPAPPAVGAPRQRRRRTPVEI